MTNLAEETIEAGLDYINKGTHRVVHVTKVEGSSVRFHDLRDPTYSFTESLFYFRNDFRQYQEG